MQEDKVVVWGGFTNSWGKKRSERQGRKKRYTQLNAEIQRVVRRNKKAFLSEQCKEVEENNRMRKTRDFFNKIGDTKETFHARMNTIKERNSKDLIEAEVIRKWWQEYAEEPYKKGLNDPENHMVIHREPGNVECEVK